MVLIEAMAHGCAIVSSRQAPQDGLLDYGRAGVLVDPRAPVELALALESLVLNRDHRRALAARGRERFLSHYHHRPVGALYRRVFDEALDRRR
jgi:glycosyltransferase involved in cell wall biosynthesis